MILFVWGKHWTTDIDQCSWKAHTVGNISTQKTPMSITCKNAINIPSHQLLNYMNYGFLANLRDEISKTMKKWVHGFFLMLHLFILSFLVNLCSTLFHSLQGRFIGTGTIIYSVVLSWRSQFSQNYQQKTPHSMPIRACYGVSFVDPASDWYSTSVPAIIYAVSYYIGPCYNSTQL